MPVVQSGVLDPSQARSLQSKHADGACGVYVGFMQGLCVYVGFGRLMRGLYRAVGVCRVYRVCREGFTGLMGLLGLLGLVGLVGFVGFVVFVGFAGFAGFVGFVGLMEYTGLADNTTTIP